MSWQGIQQRSITIMRADEDAKDSDFLSRVAHVQRDGYGGMFVGAGVRRATRLVDAGLLAFAWLDDDATGGTKRSVTLRLPHHR